MLEYCEALKHLCVGVSERFQAFKIMYSESREMQIDLYKTQHAEVSRRTREFLLILLIHGKKADVNQGLGRGGLQENAAKSR